MLEIDERDRNRLVEVQQVFQEAQAELEEAQITAIGAMDQGKEVFLAGLHAEIHDP